MYSALLTKITHNSNKSHRSWTIRHTKLAGTCYIRSLGYPRLTAAHAQFLACGKLEKLSVKTRLEEKAAEEAIRQSWQAYSSKFHSPLFQRSLELENRCTIEAQRSRGDKKASNFVVDSVLRLIAAVTMNHNAIIVSHCFALPICQCRKLFSRVFWKTITQLLTARSKACTCFERFYQWNFFRFLKKGIHRKWLLRICCIVLFFLPYPSKLWNDTLRKLKNNWTTGIHDRFTRFFPFDNNSSSVRGGRIFLGVDSRRDSQPFCGRFAELID